jgi:Glycosyl hydrolase family 20, domain 2
MRRRDFLSLGPACCLLPPAGFAQLAEGADPIPEPHFPSRLHLFVWRNWELANADRMAEVIRTKPEVILEIGASMGLPAKRRLTDDQLARIYITAIRQNWHVLPQDQIIQLLGWNRQRFSFTLKEDDFLVGKLGMKKPRCAELVYAPPSPAEQARAAEIRATVKELFGDAIRQSGEDLCHFVKVLSDPAFPPLRSDSVKAAHDEVDLSRGWSLDAAPDLAREADRFRSWLRQAMQADLKSAAGAKRVHLAIDPARVSGPESYRLQVATAEVAITGHDRAGVLQALGRLQDQMEQREAPFLRIQEVQERAVWNPRYLYSYFALYGDPLMEPERDPFPDAYLEKLARCGLNGVWMQAVLNTLAPSPRFPEFGQGWETRLRNLNALVERARRFGVRIFLYLNEPRAMPDAFFRNHPEIRGSSHQDLYSMCTSTPQVREWIADSLAHVVKHVPEIGGFFSITMSENHTNCFSHGGAWGNNAPNAGDCPRCAKRASWDAIGELIGTFRDGIRRHSATAELISWDWGWGDALAEKLIPLLPKDSRFLSISEWYAPVDRGGVHTTVGEYSISVVGPGPRARRNWQRARAAGIAPMAKTQFNNTWEISAVPYIPVPHLILEHCENLSQAGVSGIMPSWTCGGYPSPNLAAAKAYAFEPRRPRNEILREVAVQRYGEAAAAGMVDAWRQFSEAFREYPYGVHVYIIPTQHGPANPLRLERTGYKPGMILFPYDDYKAWSGAYPPDVVQKQFAKMAALWNDGLATMERSLGRVSPRKKANAQLDWAIARTCYHHFQSTANQVEFYLLRDAPKSSQSAARMRAIAAQEIELARRQFEFARDNSVVAYEASNHYYYTPLDLVEKTLQCRHVIRQLEGER